MMANKKLLKDGQRLDFSHETSSHIRFLRTATKLENVKLAATFGRDFNG